MYVRYTPRFQACVCLAVGEKVENRRTLLLLLLLDDIGAEDAQPVRFAATADRKVYYNMVQCTIII